MTTFTLQDRRNLVRALNLKPAQNDDGSCLAYLMQEVELDDAKYAMRNDVYKIKNYLAIWLSLEDETDDNPIVKLQQSAQNRLDIRRERIDGQFEIEYDSSKLPYGYVSPRTRKREQITKILRLLDPSNKLHRYMMTPNVLPV